MHFLTDLTLKPSLNEGNIFFITIRFVPKKWHIFLSGHKKFNIFKNRKIENYQLTFHLKNL